MSTYRIASRYAKSLIDLATEQGKLDTVVSDMKGILAACSQRDMELLLKSPIVKPDMKGKVMEALFKGKIDPLTFSFIDILIRKGREAQLPDIAREIAHQHREIKGISIVKVISAQPLSDESLNAIRQKLLSSEQTHKEIQFETSVDPTLIGGFVISFEDKLYDASVKRQLDKLRKEFSSNDYVATF